MKAAAAPVLILIAYHLIPPSFAAARGYASESEHVVWFPDPSPAGELAGRLIPAYLSRQENTTAPEVEDEEPDASKVHFYLHNTNSSGNEIVTGDSNSYARSGWIPGGKLRLLAHGFGGDVDSYFPQGARNHYLPNDGNADVNLIYIGWPKLAASPFYFSAASNTKIVGEAAAAFLEFILAKGHTSLADVQLIGFSLGAHVVGIAGHQFKKRTGLSVPRVTGLDPASPLFENAATSERISDDDADFVDIIHTSAGFLGMSTAVGTVDFWPNGGKKQPGCGLDLLGTCAHSRVPYLFFESVNYPEPRFFRSCSCDEWDHYSSGSCPCSVTAHMGNPVEQTASGPFYMRTNADAPFAADFPS